MLVSGPRIKPVSLALAGRFLITGPPGKSPIPCILIQKDLFFKKTHSLHTVEETNFRSACVTCFHTYMILPEPPHDKCSHMLSSCQVHFTSVAQSCLTFCHPLNRSKLGLPVITNSRSPPKVVSIESVMPSSHLILCRPLLLLLSIFPSIKVFSYESTLHIRWPKYWSFSFNISPSSEHPGLGLLQDGLTGWTCSPRDSQESSPTP